MATLEVANLFSDRRDVFKLAKYLRLDALPEAYIYPNDQRPLRDLLRRRIGLVEARAGCYTSLRIPLMRYNLNTYNGPQLKQLAVEEIAALPLPGELQDYCTMLLQRIELLSGQIRYMDEYLKTVTGADPLFQQLLTLPGVWYTLALTIYYEVGDISRFTGARRFASYGRLVPASAQAGQVPIHFLVPSRSPLIHRDRVPLARRKPVDAQAHGRARRDVWCRKTCNRCPKDEAENRQKKRRDPSYT